MQKSVCKYSMRIDEITGKGILAYHGSLRDDIGANFELGSHFGSIKAANARIEELLDPDYSRGLDHPNAGDEQPVIYMVRLHPKKMLDMEDTGEWWNEDMAKQLHDMGILSSDQLHQHVDMYELLVEMGYDCIRYRNWHEDNGHYSYLVLDPRIVEWLHESSAQTYTDAAAARRNYREPKALTPPVQTHLWRYINWYGKEGWQYVKGFPPDEAEKWLAHYQAAEPGVSFVVADQAPQEAPTSNPHA